MKILLDENISQTLLIAFDKHLVKTVEEMGWNGIKNGDLLKVMTKYQFDILLTADKNIKYQQSIKKFPLTIIILAADNNRDETIQPLINIVRKKLNSKINKGIIEISS